MHCEVLADRKLNRTHVLKHQSAEKPNPAETEHNEKKGDQLNLTGISVSCIHLFFVFRSHSQMMAICFPEKCKVHL